MTSPKISTYRVVTPVVYAWRTPDVPKYAGWEKIGYTEQESADVRIAQQASQMSVAKEKVWSRRALFTSEAGGRFTDHDFHAYLKQQGVERELHPKRGAETPDPSDDDVSGLRPAKSFAAAAWAVAVADVSMSLDNVLAVAGAARDHPGILIIGLILSVALMGIAANFIAKYIERYRWIAYLGLAVIIYVALKMIYDGFVDQNVGILVLLK